jgi:hypothetical protein
MRWVFAILLASGCVRPSDAPVALVGRERELPTIEPLAPDIWPSAPDDTFIEIKNANAELAAAILFDGSIRFQMPEGQGCAGVASNEDMAAILRLAQRIDFWSMRTFYPAVPPGPALGYRITIQARGRRQTVVHYASEHSAIVRGDLKGWPDIGDRMHLEELEAFIESITHFDQIATMGSADIVHRGIDAARVQSRLDDALATIRVRCGPIQATAVQIIIRPDGVVADTGAIPGGALDGCPDEILRSMWFEPSCSGTNALFSLDAEGLNAEIHTIAPAE